MQNIYSKQHFLFQGRAVRVGLKLGKIGPKWDKSGTETDLKDSRFVPFWANIMSQSGVNPDLLV